MRSHAAKYTACVMLACVAAVLIAVPVFGQTVTVTVVGAGDIARCDAPYDEQTAQLIGNILGSVSTPAQVITLGDNAYSSGTRAQFANCYDNYRLSDGSTYDPSRPAWWGQYKDRTMPSLGNHEYLNSADPSIQSNPYFDYFSAQNGFKVPVAPVPNTTDNPGLTKGKGYYSYNLGSWHIVVLNSNCDYVSCDSVSAQATWLQNDLVTHPAQCTLAYMHHPLYATGAGGLEPRVKPLWQILYNKGADVILNGHDHRYERLARIDPNDNRDLTYGMRPLIAGTGGDPGGGTTDTNEPNSEIKIFGTAGILRMDLSDGYYSWAFIAPDPNNPTGTGTVMDSTATPADPNFGAENPPNSTNPAGTEACHGAPGSADTTPPDTVINSGPSGTVNTRDASFTFSSTEPSSTFECSRDGAAFSACSSPKQYTGLANGSHTFKVRATDAAGNTDQSPASRTWKVRAR
jgi:Calcineurin-like phosphoesterase